MLSKDQFTELTESIGLADETMRETLEALFATLAASELTQAQAHQVLEIFSLEGLQTLETVPRDVLDAQWQEFDYGNVRIGSFVRIAPGAYSDSDTGKLHSGRIGVLVGMKNYRCTVRYIGLQAGSMIEHPMKNVETMKR